MRAVALGILVLGTACGSSPPPSSSGPAAPLASSQPALPRSSIAAVLLHRDELGLSDDQVHAMQDLDEQLAEANAKLRAPERRLAPDAGTAQQPSAGMSRRGAGMGGMGMGGRMGRGGGRRYGGVPAANGERAPGRSIADRLDDNDTRAYLEAEKVLTDAQRERARDIAEEYREALYDRRHPNETPQ
jgi:hypothetical protein